MMRLPTTNQLLQSLAGALLCVGAGVAQAQQVQHANGNASDAAAHQPVQAWFVDGYHGGIYGHYPPGYTSFLVEQLERHPDWVINMEIEPETWDMAKVHEPEAFAKLQALVADQDPATMRVEFVNPTYAQSYFFQSSGESVIRQFEHGIRKMKNHFPTAQYRTYSSEEPCFTSCLPQILTSFGYDQAVLKNPNTCWGGYVAAHGGELVNWVGPDGTAILTVPRYASEALQENSVWQTTAFGNGEAYIQAALDQGIEKPVGMTLQDAGWRGGPWLRWEAKNHHQPSTYTTWANYFENVTDGQTSDDWHLSQEDIKPGLMWGAQVLQKMAQQSKAAENRLLVAEKISAMAMVEAGRPANVDAFDQAWHNVLLSQHHDCWIVPYNGRLGNTWAEQLTRWTNLSNAVSDLAMNNALESLLHGEDTRGQRFVRLFNPTSQAVDGVVPVAIRASERPRRWVSQDAAGKRHPVQIVASDVPGQAKMLVHASLPAMGHATVRLEEVDRETWDQLQTAGVRVTENETGLLIESDWHRIQLDASAGGKVASWVVKAGSQQNSGADNESAEWTEWVDAESQFGFNTLRGHFYAMGDGGEDHASTDQPVELVVLEEGPLQTTVAMRGQIAGHPFEQTLTVTQGSPVVDANLLVDWQDNARIGSFEDKEGWANRKRAAYDERGKLVLTFPSNLPGQTLTKNAPYDVTESKQDDSFYTTWDTIKHNVILDWVDVAEGSGQRGLAIFTDHTTSYTHGPDFPLGLTVQYAGKGLWARDYTVVGPTEIRYAMMPHMGRWDEASVAMAAERWSQPAFGEFSRGPIDGQAVRSLVDVGDSGYQVPAVFEGPAAGLIGMETGTLSGHKVANALDDLNSEATHALFVRLFNVQGDGHPQRVHLGLDANHIDQVELDGRLVKNLTPQRDADGRLFVEMAMPRFGIRTLRLSGLKAAKPHGS